MKYDEGHVHVFVGGYPDIFGEFYCENWECDPFRSLLLGHAMLWVHRWYAHDTDGGRGPEVFASLRK